VRLGRSKASQEALGDLAVREPTPDELEHLALARVSWPSRPGCGAEPRRLGVAGVGGQVVVAAALVTRSASSLPSATSGRA
jgi:hypothetical protein